MESGRYERNPDFDAERAESTADLEKLGEELGEKLRAEMDPQFGRDFEAPRKFDDEDEKNRTAEQRNNIQELQKQIDELSENIASNTQQLAALPLTIEQQALLDTINQLMAKRARETSKSARRAIDEEISLTTKQLAELPVTPEQGALLDSILELMDEREATTVQLRAALKK
ncbi:hypothetical protein CR983_03740 [Candidatus Saccharibacteria bacterium]|nr:MAG: hypothetical protein CR983_03740 [Candidatus Saccharibacteria bacterium]